MSIAQPRLMRCSTQGACLPRGRNPWEYRSQPDITGTIAKDTGRQAAGDVLRRLPLFRRALADSVTGENPRYINSLTPQQLDKAWGQVKQYFGECPTCRLTVCLSDSDAKSGFCTEDSPRPNEIAQAQAEQAASVAKAIANVFGIGDAIRQVSQAAQQASKAAARCPNDGTLAAPGTKFCPECGTAMIQPTAARCPRCSADVHGARFCPECGAKV